MPFVPSFVILVGNCRKTTDVNGVLLGAIVIDCLRWICLERRRKRRPRVKSKSRSTMFSVRLRMRIFIVTMSIRRKKKIHKEIRNVLDSRQNLNRNNKTTTATTTAIKLHEIVNVYSIAWHTHNSNKTSEQNVRSKMCVCAWWDLYLLLFFALVLVVTVAVVFIFLCSYSMYPFVYLCKWYTHKWVTV